MFSKILIANRGEIACRIMRTARRMGVKTVAVYSQADAGALHVTMADEAVAIGPAPATESYLRGDLIIAAARATGAQAIHPGYGFLSENPDFVDAVTAAGLIFIGPSAQAIRAMGLKDAAKALMEKAGVPVVPGYHGDGQALVLLATKAREIGYPVMIKARAGGGGKGMRRVDDPDAFADALSGARREAKAAFGDDRVLIEKYVERPRHIEVQVFGDNFGHVVHLFERDCSAQRRHQKVIEEAPAPFMTDEMRAAMTDAAIKAAQAIAYSGAGTIEFIVDASDGLRPDRFWFMEMNTRLQVEHPVTEMVTGIDLVEWQFRVASGEPLPRSQDEIELCGHAFEARLYGEDPARGFLPATGTLHHLVFPKPGADGRSPRIETGVRAGDTVSPFYDPMIAKIVVQEATRETALAALTTALEETEVAGSTTNLAFLGALSRDVDFRNGLVETGLIARKQDALTASQEPDAETVAWALLAASGLAAADPAKKDPWDRLSGYAHFHPLARPCHVAYGARAIAADISVLTGGRAAVAIIDGPTIGLRLGEELPLARWPGHVTLFTRDGTFTFVAPDPLDRGADDEGGASSMRAPMPGVVKLVLAALGDSVRKGQPLLVLEAMKMEHTILASQDGVITEIAAVNTQISEGAMLVRFAEATV